MPNPKTLQNLLLLCVLIFTFNFAGSSQCNLFVNFQNNPTSCNSSDGSMTFTTTGICNRNIKIFKGTTLLGLGVNSMTQTNLSSGVYKLVADKGCGCNDEITRYVYLQAVNETLLVPHINGIQSDNAFVCKGGSARIGVQPLGMTGLSLIGPGGFSDTTPDGSSFWNLSNLQPSNSGLYTINYINSKGCSSSVTLRLNVGNLTVNAGPDLEICKGSSATLQANVTGKAVCKQQCPKTLDSMLVRWTLDQCNASNQNNKDDYTEFVPEYVSKANCNSIFATNIFKPMGDHSCTPVSGSYTGDVGMCVMAEESCDTLLYDSKKAIIFEVTMNPSEGGRITGLSFNEQSPFIWITTNGATGPNNYNTKYLIKVYKNNLLIYSKTEIPTGRTWNPEFFDFKDISDFHTNETAVYRFELRGYCVTENGGNMAGWEVDDIKIFGGCCTGLETSDTVSYLWSNGQTNQSIIISPEVNSNYFVTVTDCNGCSHVDTVGVKVNALPVVTISGIKTICTGGSTVLTASGGSRYVWSTGETTAALTITPSSTSTYYVSVTDEKGCLSVDSAKVVVNNLPSPVISGDFEICKGESTTLTASGGTLFEWSTGATTKSIVVSPSSSTEYLVMAVDDNGCMEYSTALVVVFERPESQISGDSVICIGETTSLTATGGSTYLWSNGMTNSTINVTPATNTQYIVTVTDEHGCSSTTSKNVIVHPVPVVVVSGNSSLCNGKSSTLTATGGVSYKWSTGATTSTIMINPGLNTTYVVTVTNEQGCSSTGSRTASVINLPEARITGPLSICSGSSVSLTASGGALYLWSSGQTTSTINVSPTSNTIYRVTVTDANGCTAVASHGLKVNSKPTVAISGNDRICIGNNTTLTANVSGKTYCDKDCKDELLLRWTLDQCNAQGLANQLDYSEFLPINISSGGLLSVSGTNVTRNRGDHSCTPDGTGGIGMCFGVLESCDPNQYNPQNALKFTFTLNPTKSAKLTKLTFREQSPLIWTTTNGASGINNYNQKYLIRIYKNGSLIYSQNDINTERNWNLETFNFSDHPDFTITEVSDFTVELYGYCIVERGGIAGWEIDDFNVFGGECQESETVTNASYLWSTGATTSTINVLPSSSTIYTVSVTDCNGCISSDSIMVQVDPLPVIVILNDGPLTCAKSSVTLTASGGVSYEWASGETTASKIATSVGTYTVTVTSSQGCKNSSSVTVTENLTPPTVTTINDGPLTCAKTSVTLTATGGGSYLWSGGGTSSTKVVNVAGTYTVTVTASNGCTSTSSTTVGENITPPTVTTINDGPLTCAKTSVTLTATGGGSYLWSGGGTSSTKVVNVAGTYTVTVTAPNGCTSTSSTTVGENITPPTVTTINDGPLTCAKTSVTLTATGGGSYLWSGSGTSSTKVVNIAGTYTVTVTASNGCTSSSSTTVVENLTPPTVTTSNDGPLTCAKTSVTLTATGGGSYLWSGGGTSSTKVVTLAGTYTVTVTASNGCTSTSSTTVGENLTPPTVTTSNDGPLTCAKTSVTLTATGGGSYLWSGGGTSSTKVVNVAGTYTVTVTAPNGCTSTSSTTVGENITPPTVTTINDGPLTCAKTSVTLTATGGGSYLWSGSGTSSTKVVNIAGTYTVTVTASNGCTSSSSTTVVENLTPPTVTTSNDGPLTCAKTSVTLTATGGGSYLWSGGGTSSTKVVTLAGTYTVTVTASNGCTSTSSTTVGENLTPPTVTTSNDGPLTCSKTSVTLTATGGGSYLWSGGGTSSTKVVNVAGTYTITVTASNGCTSTSSTTVGENITPPTVTTSNDGPLTCAKTSVTLTATGGGSYLWSGGGTSSTKVVNVAETYTVTVTASNGCTSTSSTTVGENLIPPKVTTSNDGPLTCAKMSVTLTATGGGSYAWSGGGTSSTKVVTLAGTYTVTVTVSNGCTSSSSTTVGENITPPTVTTSNDGPLTCAKTSVTLTATGGGSYLWSGGGTSSTKVVNVAETYTVTVTASNGCTSTSSTIVGENLTPPAVTTSNDGPLTCAKTSVTLTATGGGSYLWSGGGTSSTKVVTLAGTYTVTVTASNGCTSTSSTTVGENLTPPTVTTSNDGPLTCAKTNVTLTATGGGSYLWSGGGTSSTKVVTLAGTYTVTVTASNGCTSTSSTTVGENITPPTVTTSNDGPLTCAKTSVTLTATGGGSYLWSGGGTSSTKVVTLAGTYTITVTASNGCTSTSSTTVGENLTPPTVTTSNDGPLTCAKTSVTLTATGGGSYLWSGGGTSSTKVVTLAGTYTVTVTASNGCTSTSSTTVGENLTPPTVTTSNDGPLTCAKTSVTLTATGGGSYLWSGGGTSSTKVVTLAGTYTITVTASNGCTSTSSTTVGENLTPPTVTTSNDGPLTCAKTSVTLTATGGGSYLWSGGGTSSTKVVTLAGTYTITVTASNGCTSTSSTTVGENLTPPTVTTSNDGPLTCAKTSVTLTATGGGSYLWSGGGTSSTKVVTLAGTYTVTVTASNGCTSTSSTTVGENLTPPTVTTSNDGPLTCAKTSVTLTATGGESYLWSGGGTTSSKVVIVAGTYTVTVTESNGCTSTSSTTVGENITPPIVTTSNDGPLTCIKTSVTLTSTGGGSYLWSGGGTSSTKVVTVAGTYTVTVTASNGCTSTSTTIVGDVITLPTVTTNNDGPLTCSKTSVTLTATGGGSYLWSGGGTSSTKVVTAAGTYTVTVTASNGCTSTSGTTVGENITIPTVTTRNDGPLTCAKTSVTLTATGGGSYLWSGGGTSSTKIVNDASTYTVTVTASNGCTSTATSTVLLDTIRPIVNVSGSGMLTCGTTSITLFATGGGSYLWNTGEITSEKIATTPGTYNVTVTGLNGCSATGSIVVEQNITPPIVNVSNNGPLTCIKTSVTLTATGGGFYSWSGGGTNSTKTVSSPGTYTVTVTAPNRCTATANTIVLQSTTLPVASISGNEKICEGTSTILTASGGVSYIWNIGQSSASITVSPVSSTTYTVTVTNAEGCTATAVKTVMIKDKPDIVFSGVNALCLGDTAVIVATGNTDNECPGLCSISQPSVLALWNLNACQAVMTLGTHLDYSEFTPIVSKANCSNVTAGNVHRLPGNKHSCTPGPNGSIGMCIGAQKACNPSKVDFTQALRFEMSLTPAQSGQITGLEFFEQGPENYVWVDGPTGKNNYPQKYILRVSKNGKFIYYKDNIATNKTWTLQKFDFSDNDNFRTLVPATYLFELLPYCTINNGAVESIWDIDEIKVLGGCCNGTSTEIAGYKWSNGSTGTSITVKPTENTSYIVTVTDCCGCTNTKMYNVNVANLVADLGEDRMISMGQSVTLSPTITGQSICDANNPDKNGKYLWSTGTTTASITVTPSSSSFYRVTVTDCNECADTESTSIHVMMPRPVVVYPNPAYNKVNLASETEIDPEVKVRIISSDGKTVISEKPELIFNSPSNISVLIPENIRDGMYYIEIKNGQNKYVEKLILIER